MKEIPFFKQVCMNFHFEENPNCKIDTLVFAKIDCIFQLNFITQEITTVY